MVMPRATQVIENSKLHLYKERFDLFPKSHVIKNEKIFENVWASPTNISEGQ